MDKADLKKLQDKLKAKFPMRYAKMIREKSGKSYSSIYKTFDERDPLIVMEVVDAAIAILKESIEKDQSRLNSLSELL
jgi:hypothetical protein